MKNFIGKTALVTAATRGIGKACALRLGVGGARVYVAALERQDGEAVVTEIERAGGKGAVVSFDARDPESYRRIVLASAEQTGHLDILVNNYGGTDPKRDLSVGEGDAEDFFRMLEDNIRSVYLPVQAAIPYMEGGGSIVNISSVGAVFPDVSRTAYGTAKAAINFLTQEIAVQYARKGIRCNAVMPGLTATASAMKHMSESFREEFIRHVPLRRMARPEEVAEAAAFLSGDSASFITGEILSVSGGFGIATPLYKELTSNT